ncbi:MAG: hypothetical protein H6578_11240 [Chitinophagales bacterium]|nr:hypothetical protein [Chitinophagales bacterium]
MSIISLSLAQTDTVENKLNRKEFHLRIQDFSPFSIGIDYKQQVKPKGYFVVSLTNVSYSRKKAKSNNPLDYPSISTSASAGLMLGYEFRREFKKKFSFYHGPNLGYRYNYTKRYIENPSVPPANRTLKTNQHSAVLKYNVGFMYQFHKNILVSAQISPQFRYSHSKILSGINTSNEDDFNFSLSNLAGTLALVFRFNE